MTRLILFYLFVIFVILFMISCGARKRHVLSQSVQLESKTEQSISSYWKDSIKSYLTSFSVNNQVEEFEPFRDRQGNLIMDKDGKPQTYIKRSAKTETTKTENEQTQVNKGTVKQYRKEEINTKITQKETKKEVEAAMPKPVIAVFFILFLLGIAFKLHLL